MGRVRIEGIEEEDLLYLYNEKEMSQREISVYYGVSQVTIHNRMIEHNVSARSAGGNGKTRKYSINEDFFKTWTLESAWMYGWALGDGWGTSLNLGFGLARIDREVLEKFTDVLDSEHPVKDYKQWNEKYQKYFYGSKVVFFSKKLVADLSVLSIYDVPKEYFSHFLRGFFEAEGYAYWHKRNTPKGGRILSGMTQNDYDILDFIHWCLHEFGIVEGGSIHPHGKGWQLIFSVNDSISLYHYMYDNCDNIFLIRKKEKFEELIEKQNG